jgi:hypothetical protein
LEIALKAPADIVFFLSGLASGFLHRFPEVSFVKRQLAEHW